jgi:putative transposase
MDEEREEQRLPRSVGQRYTAQERAAVLADVPALGCKPAAAKHGVPAPNVFRWAKAAGITKASSRDETPTAPASPPPPPPPPPPVVVIAKAKAKAAPARRKSTASAKAVPPPWTGSKSPSATDLPAATPPAKSKAIARSYTPSERAQILEYAAEKTVTESATKFNVSRFSIYDWQRKVGAAAKGAGPSPTSGPGAKDIEARRDKEILDEWSRHPGLGPSQIRNQLRRKSVKVSVHTVRRVMEGAGYRPPKVARHPHIQRFEAVRPNHLWHLDFVHRNIHRASTFTLILIDDHSRFVVGQGVDDAERADMVIGTFERAVARYGKPEMVMHDRGAAFWSWNGISRFTALLTELGIDQIVAVDKEHNGKVEVFNANLAKELFDVQRFADVGEMRRRLDTHMHWYNHGRTHHALGGLLVPADRYYGRVDEVLARIEAGAGRDVGDGIDLRARSLDLFKVTSRDGVPEVWLMGRKLIELRP